MPYAIVKYSTLQTDEEPCCERQVQSLFLKPRKFSPSAFKLFEHYLDRLLLKKEQQAVRTLIHKC